jgi:hypothetical protein
MMLRCCGLVAGLLALPAQQGLAHAAEPAPAVALATAAAPVAVAQAVTPTQAVSPRQAVSPPRADTPPRAESPAKASVVLRGLPLGGLVLLDGAPVPLGTDSTLTLAAAVEHRLEVRAAGRLDWQQTIQLTPAEQRTLELRLRKRAPWTPWLVAGSGALLAAAGAAGFAVLGQLPASADWQQATRAPDTNQYVSVGYADAEAGVRDANLARGVSLGVGGVGVAALATGVIWRLLMDLEPDEWRAPASARPTTAATGAPTVTAGTR